MLRRISAYSSQTRILKASSAAPFSVSIPRNHNLQGMIEWYQRNGHKHAQTDPLGLKK